jgi:SAM-dependent methyltransferase
MATAFPNARVDGIDLDPDSIAQAERNASEAGVAERVRLRCASADELDGAYDLICALECLHDMSDPASVLRAARRHLAPGGAVFVAEERVAEEFTAPGDEVERFHYGWSAVHCLAASLNHQPSAAIGTAIRTSTVRALAESAGFTRFDVLSIEDEMLIFYRLG